MSTAKKKTGVIVLSGALALSVMVVGSSVSPVLAQPNGRGPMGPPVMQFPNQFQGQVSVSMDRAKEMALERTGGVVVRYATKYPKHGGLHYHIDTINNGFRNSIHIDAFSGYIIRYRQEAVYQDNNFTGVSPGISMETAAATARQHAGGGTITSCKLEYRHREQTLLYHLQVMNNNVETHIHLRASDGAVLLFEQRSHF